MIAQLKAENFEYRQKEKDYNILHSQLLDLEHRFRLLQEEKSRAEHEAHDHEDQNYKKNDGLQSDIRVIKATIDDKQKQLKDLGAELSALKELASDKGEEISQMKHEIAEASVLNNKLLKDKKAVEGELAFESDNKRAAQLEADRIAGINDRISQEQAEISSRARENEVETLRLNERINDINRQLTDTEVSKHQREIELDAELAAKRNVQHDIDDLLIDNGKMQEDNKVLQYKANDMELQIKKLNKRLDDILNISDVKDKELRNSKASLSYADEKAQDIREQAKKLQRENEVLQSLLDKYRGDVNLQKQLRDEEIGQKLQVEQEKKRLERHVMSKELEVQDAKKELEKVQENKEKLIDHHYMLNQELGALKEHADLLENQNKTV